MTMKTLTCREHGGTFKIPSRRGRPPVRCSEDHPCNKSDTTRKWKRVAEDIADDVAPPARKPARARKMTEAESLDRRKRDSAAIRGTVEAPERAARPRSRGNASLALAQEAKTLLEAQGWSCAGKAWTETGNLAPAASLVGTRGEEMITLLWINGVLTDQRYSLWNVNRPSMNGKPVSKLPFNPDEATDSEVARFLSGMRVVWWNRIGRFEEHAVIPDKITVQHVFNGTGDETPGERLVIFVDRDGTGFHAFRLDALIRIGTAA